MRNTQEARARKEAAEQRPQREELRREEKVDEGAGRIKAKVEKAAERIKETVGV